MDTNKFSRINMEIILEESLRHRLERLNGHEEKFTFFWETRSPFSKWYKCQFSSKVFDFTQIGLPEVFAGVVHFSSAEQFMMLHKALLFSDHETAVNILRTKDVREQKRLGRAVKNFDEQVWRKFRVGIVYEGNKNKFNQNPALLEALFNTKGSTLVEAAPDDAVWGIGLVKDDARALKRETWLGPNLLGEVLTFIRTELQNEY